MGPSRGRHCDTGTRCAILPSGSGGGPTPGTSTWRAFEGKSSLDGTHKPPRAARAREQTPGVPVHLYLLLHKIKLHLCYTLIHSINQAFKKSPGAQSHPFFDFPSDDVTLHGSQVLSKDKSRRGAWPRQPLAVNSKPAR